MTTHSIIHQVALDQRTLAGLFYDPETDSRVVYSSGQRKKHLLRDASDGIEEGGRLKIPGFD